MAAVEELTEQPDFLFGPLASEPERAAYVRDRRLGVVVSRAPRDPDPGEPVVLDVSVGPHRPDPTLVVDGVSVPLEPAGVEWDTLVWGYIRHLRATIDGRPAGTVRYRVGDEEQAYAVDDYRPPRWAREAVVYHVFVDRFDPGPGREWGEEPFRGGTLRGVLRRLDHIVSLGATAIWLSPIFPSPTYHGYDATDLFDVEPRLGTKDDLRALLDEAHAHGVRVLLDFVPNHWSDRHPTFVEATSDAESAYRDWYSFERWPDRYDSFFGVRTLPKVNLLNADAREHMLAAAAHWLELGVDGYRVDHAVGPAQSFWADFRHVTREAQPDCWTFGETVETPLREREFEGLLDGSLDFTLLEALRKTFAQARWDGVRFWRFLDSHSRYFPPDFVRPAFLDNHDMNRFLWLAGGDVRRLKLAALCQFTLEGPPIIYYGTEIGMTQVRDVRGSTDLEARLPMAWEASDEDLLAWYRRLVALRRRLPEVWREAREPLVVDPELLVYRVGGRVTVALNLSERAQSVEGVTIPPLGGRILELEGEEEPWPA
jgi:cyclomaltodextrinase / maltogenic alpha-amylase / neopullulanase